MYTSTWGGKLCPVQRSALNSGCPFREVSLYMSKHTLLRLAVQYSLKVRVHIHVCELIENRNYRPQMALRPTCRWRTVTQYAGCISANTRPHQLCWGDWKCGYHMSCMCNTDGWPQVFTVTQLGSLWQCLHPLAQASSSEQLPPHVHAKLEFPSLSGGIDLLCIA